MLLPFHDMIKGIFYDIIEVIKFPQSEDIVKMSSLFLKIFFFF